MSRDAAEARYRSRSLWLDTVPGSLTPRPALPGDVDVDVAIVGAGYTGLWTAYELLLRDPTLQIALLDAEIAGFGASGRNGGWCSAAFAGSRAVTARRHGRDAAIAMQRAMFDTVRRVGEVCATESIDAHYHRGGTLELARTPAQAERMRRHVEEEREWGNGSEDYEWLEAGAARERMAATEVLGAVYTPHCARIHPARLARGLAEVVERRGARIYEQTPAREITPRRIDTDRGRVRAEVVVRATEGYTPMLAGERRTLVPIYSLMVATEPLPRSFWEEVGWEGRETFTDGRRLVIYGQRTADDRIAFGGRGAPYHFGSRVRDDFDRDPPTFAGVREILREIFPALRDARFTHEWGGPLGVPRDWYPSVGYDPVTGLAWAGGYVGDGVGTSALAGRTLADLVLRIDSDATALPWVDHRWPQWEPEPLRWLGINLTARIVAGADRSEARGGRAPRWRERFLSRLTG